MEGDPSHATSRAVSLGEVGAKAAGIWETSGQISSGFSRPQYGAIKKPLGHIPTLLIEGKSSSLTET
jgi:hypothetical protein